jgi:hypothetical protein
MRNDSLTRPSIGPPAIGRRSKPEESDCPSSSTNASRTNPEGETPRALARSNSAAFKPHKSTLMRSRDEDPIPEPPDMRSVSDNGATAPISALTYAFSIGLDRGLETDDFEAQIIETAVTACRRAPQRRRKGDAKATGHVADAPARRRSADACETGRPAFDMACR